MHTHTSQSTRERLHNRPRTWTVVVLSAALILAQLALVGQAAARTRRSTARTVVSHAGAHRVSVAHARAAAEPKKHSKKHSKLKPNRKHKKTTHKHPVKRSTKNGSVHKSATPAVPASAGSAAAASASGPSTVTAGAGSSSSTSPLVTPSGTVLFDGSAISSWWLNQSATASRVQSVPDPTGAAGTAQQFTTYNSDVAPLTPTNNPRSQLCTPEIFKSGQQYWESFEIYVPTSFTFSKTGWLFLESAVYGQPWQGQAPLTISIENGAFRFQRNGVGTHPWQIAWTTPVVKGQWYRFTWHFDLSTSGWVELYVNDVQQPLLNGSAQVMRLPIATLDSSDSKGPWYSQEQVYYQHNAYPSATLDFKDYKVGTTQVAAES